MASIIVREDNKVEIVDSCGCVFCDLGDKPQPFRGKPAHYQRDGSVMLCIRDTSQTPKRAQ